MGALAAAAAAPRRASAADSLRLGYLPSYSNGEVFVAMTEGFFERAGITAQLQPFSNGGFMANAILGGAIDIGGINTLSIAVAYQKGVPLRIVGFGTMYNTNSPTTELVVAKTSTIQTAKDLEGKVIGLSGLQGAPQIATQLWIEKNGGDYTKVRFVEVPISAQPAALESGRIDAAIMPEPSLSQTRAATRVLGKSYDGIGTHWINDGFCATTEWSNANAALVHRFSFAIFAANAWCNHNQPKVVDIYARAVDIDPSPMRSMTYANFIDKPDVAAAQPVIDAGARFGLLKSSFPAMDMFCPAAIR